MKKLIILFLVLLLVSCKEKEMEKIEGIVIDKEYIPARTSIIMVPRSTGKTTIMTPTLIFHSAEHKIKIEYTRKNLKSIKVNSTEYENIKIGDLKIIEIEKENK